MAGIINISPRPRSLPGGVLGEQSKAINEIIDALGAIVPRGNNIIISRVGKGFKVDYVGKYDTGWSGVVRWADGSIADEVDLSDPVNIEDEYIHVDNTTGAITWSGTETAAAGSSSFRVANELSANAKTLTGYDFTLSDNVRGDITLWAADGGLDVAGTPGLFKVVALVGWEKADAVTPWAQMSVEDSVDENPTRLWTDFVDGVDSYPWYGLRATWDYVRAYEEP